MDGGEHCQFRAPEGTYVCVDWVNPILNRNAAQHGANAAHGSAFNTLSFPAATRMTGSLDSPRMSAVPLRKPSASSRIETSLARMTLDPSQVAQGIDADPADYVEIGAEGEAPQEFRTHFTGLHRTMGVLSSRPTRPKTGLKGSNSTFVTRTNTCGDLGKLLAQRNDSITISFFIASKTLMWFANIGSRNREPIARVTFSSVPTCLDVNQFTRCSERLDLLVGFNTGDILWIDPVHLRYTRINKGGALNSSSVHQIRWLPRNESLFVSAHADGAMIVFDRDREDATSCAHLPEPSPDWNPLESVFVSYPPEGTTEEQGNNGWRITKPKEVSWSSLNPVSYWRVSNRGITDLAFSPDNTSVAIVAEDGVLRVVDLDSETYVLATDARLVRSMASYFGGFTCIVWSPDGRLLLTGGQDDLLTLWAAHEGRIVARAQGHRSFVTAAAFDPWHTTGSEDAHRFVSVSEDCCLCLWDFSPEALQRPRAFARGATGARGERTSMYGAAHGRPSVFTPAPNRAEVAMLQPTTVAKIPGAMLSCVRVAPKGICLVHADGQLDWLARPQRPRIMPLTTELDAAQLASADPDDSTEIKSPSRSGLSLPFTRGIPGLRKRTSQSLNGAVAT